MVRMFTSSHTLRRTLAVGAAVVVAAALAVTPAAAHTELRGSNPEEGATVETLDQVRLDFSSALLDIGAELALIDADGTSHELTPEFPEGEHAVVAQVPVADVAAGQTVLDWRIVAEDGHPIAGEVTFTYAPVAPEQPVEEPTQEPQAADEPEVVDEPEANETTDPAQEATPISAEVISDEPESESLALWAWVLIGAALIGLVVTALVMVRKRADA